MPLGGTLGGSGGGSGMDFSSYLNQLGNQYPLLSQNTVLNQLLGKVQPGATSYGAAERTHLPQDVSTMFTPESFPSSPAVGSAGLFNTGSTVGGFGGIGSAPPTPAAPTPLLNPGPAATRPGNVLPSTTAPSGVAPSAPTGATTAGGGAPSAGGTAPTSSVVSNLLSNAPTSNAPVSNAPLSLSSLATGYLPIGGLNTANAGNLAGGASPGANIQLGQAPPTQSPLSQAAIMAYSGLPGFLNNFGVPGSETMQRDLPQPKDTTSGGTEQPTQEGSF